MHAKSIHLCESISNHPLPGEAINLVRVVLLIPILSIYSAHILSSDVIGVAQTIC